MDDGIALSHADHNIIYLGLASVIACLREQQQNALAALGYRVQQGDGLVHCIQNCSSIVAGLQLSEFFAAEAVSKEMSGLNLNEDEIRFLTQVQRYSANLSESDRRLLLAMVRKFAQTSLS